jgi:hypothetical protein
LVLLKVVLYSVLKPKPWLFSPDCSENPFCFFFKNKKIETKGGNEPWLKIPTVLLQIKIRIPVSEFFEKENFENGFDLVDYLINFS